MDYKDYKELKPGDIVLDRNMCEMIVRAVRTGANSDLIECQEMIVDDDGNGDFTGEILHNLTRHDIKKAVR